MPVLEDKIQLIKGIGPKKVKLFEKLNIRTLRDALEFYPRDYEDRTSIVRIADIGEEGKYAIRGVVRSNPSVHQARSGTIFVKFMITDGSGAMDVIFFNNPYAASDIVLGREYLFYGKTHLWNNTFSLSAPVYEEINPNDAHPGRIVPIYSLTAGLFQYDIEKVTAAALAAVPSDITDPIPEYLRDRYHLLPLAEALEKIHRPKTTEDVEAARRRMVFEELFMLCCGLQQLKERRKEESGIVFDPDVLNAFWGALPFSPTGAQRRAIEEIAADCASGRPMNRLVQGDVGSGKTIVAAAACALAARNGYQAAFMAPTEILAAQHEKSLRPILSQMGVSCILLTGAMTAAQKRDALDRIASGEMQVVIGTHALIQQGVEFYRLGAVVADEQHRFGVAQRAALSAKGDSPHVLVMSATPIPRTLALIMYGDLDVSVLDELPPGRSPVKTYGVGANMRPRITAFIDKQIQEGGQVYVVCPLVGDGETDLKSAEQHAKALHAALPHRNIAILHGRMKNTDKDQVMKDFADRKYDILVATTVIEVGVDVPNANLIVVEDADRFGLSQLHQLRGRVGRGSRQSYCIFFGADKGEKARERLKVLCGTKDGFKVAQADLAQRGPGDFFGQRQHGLPKLHIADLSADLALMQEARVEAEDILQKDPALEKYPVLREHVQKMFAKSEGEVYN